MEENFAKLGVAMGYNVKYAQHVIQIEKKPL